MNISMLNTNEFRATVFTMITVTASHALVIKRKFEAGPHQHFHKSFKGVN